MTPFTTHTGVIATLDRANVDTDQIIPKQFLKSIRRTGFGENLFFDWRYRADGSPDPAFELNAPAFQGASILVTRNNFGCGSSREHAVWAIAQYGFRAVLAPRAARGDEIVPAFADIFRNNAGKNGLLTIELSEAEVQSIFEAVAAGGRVEADLDLAAQTVTVKRARPLRFSFEIDAALKEKLLHGRDDIALSLAYAGDIARFESGHDTQSYAP